MDVLWAPWRLDYILGPKPDRCVFCLPEQRDEDEARYILHRGRRAFVIMNVYPYNNGHLMVCPYRHVMTLLDLDADEHHEIMDLMVSCESILRGHFNPGGLNVGLNLGEAAGAGIREHLHFHLVPRWNGDNSFMALADTRVVPEHLRDSYNRLKPYFQDL